ncbi:trihelix transcription factor GTL1 [Brachypodium distachyon]|uniref:Myb-like domain-containing protein n=1 Tax=Brachypodium distachyon TaxID=15368 RepID=I1HW35_BRADI|nr:trihelix transcription factor GTL1 [Brachypodium distachyon]KQJ92790.1 hypothetical protein BRADI_3g00697v3 [Brachypodium distachyon]|eukprot:XP_003570777.1 trihelix transcription factor GTL1 [Brachypodium distachyon]
MQSGYGGVSEFQQFIMDGGFAMAAAPPPPPTPQQQHAAAAAAAAGGQQELGAPFRYQPLHHHAMHPQQHHHHAPPQMPPHFAHFGGPTAAGGGIPFTQQLLHHQAAGQQHHHHHLQLFHEQQHHHHQQQQQHHKPQQPQPRWAPQQQQHHQHQQQHLGLDMEAAVPESTRAAAVPSGMPPFLAAAMNFKLAVDQSGSGATDDAMNDGGGGGSGMMLHGGGGGGAGRGEDEAATESRLRRWTGEEEASIKEPAWRPLDIDFIHSTSSSSKRAAGKDKAPTPESPSPAANAAANYFKKGGDDNVTANAAAAGGGNSSYKLFSELEAIYKPGSGGAGQTTGSGSGLTGDDNAMADLPHAPPPTMCPDGDDDILPHAPPPQPQANASETSAGEETETPAVVQPPQPPASMADGRRKRKRRRSQEAATAASSFFERLVQRLMEHQESLHAQFLSAMDRRERERAARDEAWRRQESESSARERAARARDRASAAAREAAIVSYLEKLSGHPIVLPPPAPSSPAPAASEEIIIPQPEASSAVGTELVPYDAGVLRSSSASPSRWPKQEVEALIRVRSGLERRFQEPGLKGPLWEEVSARMAAAGYGGRSAKRCKEKWENINKYFRKAKESGKKRPAHAKTCPYFDELNRLYSGRGGEAMDAAGDGGAGKAASSELLDAVVKCPAGTAAGDQAAQYGPPPGFAPAGDGEDEGLRDMAVDGGEKYDDGEDGEIGRSAGGRAMAMADQDQDEGESHGGHHDEDDEEHH